MTRSILLVLATAVAAAGCKSVECGDGTIERDGKCQPADETVGNAVCGPFTQLEGDKCVPMFPPTVCDPGTTMSDPDPTTGVITCIGTGGGGCSAQFACPTPASGKSTICGQIYDSQDMSAFAAPNATGALCDASATTGPCSLRVKAFDAIAFAMNPTGATELNHGTVYLDDCGRYRVPDISPPGGPFVALGIDDSNAAMAGPAGTTNATGVATTYVQNMTIPNFEAFIATAATTAGWDSSSGNMLAETKGYFVNIFRAHKKTGNLFAPQAGVTITRNGATIPNDDFYFTSTEITHQTIDPLAMATGANGSVVVINGTNPNDDYTGQGALPPECKWETHKGVTLPFIVFFQIKRPINQTGMTCNL
jgi:hypothetical protein